MIWVFGVFGLLLAASGFAVRAFLRAIGTKAPSQDDVPLDHWRVGL